MDQLFASLHTEYLRPIDQFSYGVIASSLELVFQYTERYYQRQFVTRKLMEAPFLSRFEALLHERIHNADLADSGVPTVGYFAEQLHLSPNYLSEMLRSLTGKSTQDHIHFELLEKAKSLLLSSEHSISEIAFQLGFSYPQYFSRLFKRKLGKTPGEFRKLG